MTMQQRSNFFQIHKASLLYGLALAILLFLLKWLEIRYLLVNQRFELYTGALAAFFTTLGVWLTLKLRKTKTETIIVEKEIQTLSFKPDEIRLHQLQLSKREFEVLELMALGHSNQEIADRLFVSVNTVKTHSARLFEKLEVKRRTQAVDRAKRLRLIP